MTELPGCRAVLPSDVPKRPIYLSEFPQPSEPSRQPCPALPPAKQACRLRAGPAWSWSARAATPRQAPDNVRGVLFIPEDAQIARGPRGCRWQRAWSGVRAGGGEGVEQERRGGLYAAGEDQSSWNARSPGRDSAGNPSTSSTLLCHQRRPLQLVYQQVHSETKSL